MATESDPGGDARRALPSIERLLQLEAGRPLIAAYGRGLTVDALRQTLEEARAALRASHRVPENGALLTRAGDLLQARFQPSLRPAINATGVILHTNLGRAPLSEAARRAMDAVARGYATLEFDIEAGERGSRHDHVTPLLQRLTGGEAALVVNNNASAVLLALAATAAGREVVISRGQLVEIGGGFRIPDVLRQSGAHLVEVGTTNRTYVEDYAAAITQDTAALLRVHASNFRLTGFVHSATLEQLVGLARDRGLQVVDDLGSGSLLPTEQYGLAHEPMVQESVAADADLVCFSGDKLLGGPQAGLIVGRADAVAQLRRHPLTRAVRPDKATLAALHATLVHYERGEAEAQIPIWRMLAASEAELEQRARRIAALTEASGASAVPTRATVGGGSLPGETLPSWAVAVAATSAEAIAARLRRSEPPIIGRIAEDRVLLDLRTVAPDEDAVLAAAIRGL